MKIGSWKQKASPVLVSFVFGCIFITTILLYIMQTSVAVGTNLADSGGQSQN
jgi:hypothetical protein